MDQDIDNTGDLGSDTMGENEDTKRGSTTTRSQSETGEIGGDDTELDTDDDDITGSGTSRSQSGAGE